MSGSTPRSLAVGMAVVASVLAAAPAQAATTIGSDLAPAPDLGLLCVPSCTLSSPQINGSSTASPLDGVVVRWRIRAGAAPVDVGPVSLRILRPAGGNDRVGVGTSQGENTALSSVSTFATRLPIKAGDFVGIDIGNGGPNYFNTTDATDTRLGWQPKIPDGGPPTAPSNIQASREVLMNADIEPDADSDSFGDETQDLCPTDATTQGACPFPETTITKKPTKKHRRRSIVRFESSGANSTFRCILDGSDSFDCASPQDYQDLDPGRHTFAVAATNKSGNTDKSPAETRFFLKKQR